MDLLLFITAHLAQSGGSRDVLQELMMCIHYQNNNQNIITKWPGINSAQRTRCEVEHAAWEKMVSKYPEERVQVGSPT